MRHDRQVNVGEAAFGPPDLVQRLAIVGVASDEEVVVRVPDRVPIVLEHLAMTACSCQSGTNTAMRFSPLAGGRGSGIAAAGAARSRP